LLFVAAVAALGVGARGCSAVGSAPVGRSDRAALAEQIAAVDSVIVVGGARRPVGARKASRPVPPSASQSAPDVRAVRVVPARTATTTGLVDVDLASAAELDRLPGIGPALAGRIVAEREERGPFGSLRGLERVRGIGPALAAKLAPHVTFSLAPRPSDTEVPPRGRVFTP